MNRKVLRFNFIFTVILLLFSILLLTTACRTSMMTRQSGEVKTDSTVCETRTVKILPVPEQKAELSISLNSLTSLDSFTHEPVAPSFFQRNGRASVQVTRSGDIIHIVATCDSLQALCEYYEREMKIRNQKSKMETVIEERSKSNQIPFKYIFITVAGGIIAGSVTFKISKILK